MTEEERWIWAATFAAEYAIGTQRAARAAAFAVAEFRDVNADDLEPDVRVMYLEMWHQEEDK